MTTDNPKTQIMIGDLDAIKEILAKMRSALDKLQDETRKSALTKEIQPGDVVVLNSDDCEYLVITTSPKILTSTPTLDLRLSLLQLDGSFAGFLQTNQADGVRYIRTLTSPEVLHLLNIYKVKMLVQP